MKFDQGLPNKDYLYYLFENMREYCSQRTPKERIYIDPRYNKAYYSYSFSTLRQKRTQNFLAFCSELFTDNTVKQEKTIKMVPACIGELLTPGALAF